MKNKYSSIEQAYQNMVAPLSPEDGYGTGKRDRKFQEEREVFLEQMRRGRQGAGPSKYLMDLAPQNIKYR